MKYASVLELRVGHLYYTGGRCPDVTIEPAAETARLLARHRGLLRSNEGEVRVVTPLDLAGQPLVPLPAGASLRFALRPAGDDFELFTDLSALSVTPSPLFTNAHLAAGVTGELPLTSQAPPAPPAVSGVLAEVEIVLHEGDTVGRATPAAAFRVTFRPRRWRWAYYCITDLEAGGELSVVAPAPGGSPDAPSFGAANRSDLNEHPDPTDPIATQLAARYPAMRRIRFLSDQPVACREDPSRLELRLGGDRVLGPLPNPAPRHFSRRGPAPGVPEAEGLLFQIVEYRAHPFATP